MNKWKKTVLLSVAALFFLIAGKIFWNSGDTVETLTASQNKRASVIKLQQPSAKGGDLSQILYVQAKVVNLRQHPSLKSQSIWKLLRGQKLTQLHRTGSWIRILPQGTDGISGWVHESLVGKNIPHSTKNVSTQTAFRNFRKTFNRFNNDIKQLKGVALFMGVQLKDKDEVLVTATNVLLSAPEHYQRKYLTTILNMWAEAKHHTGLAHVALVDGQGKKRMETKKP